MSIEGNGNNLPEQSRKTTLPDGIHHLETGVIAVVQDSIVRVYAQQVSGQEPPVETVYQSPIVDGKPVSSHTEFKATIEISGTNPRDLRDLFSGMPQGAVQPNVHVSSPVPAQPFIQPSPEPEFRTTGQGWSLSSEDITNDRFDNIMSDAHTAYEPQSYDEQILTEPRYESRRKRSKAPVVLASMALVLLGVGAASANSVANGGNDGAKKCAANGLSGGIWSVPGCMAEDIIQKASFGLLETGPDK